MNTAYWDPDDDHAWLPTQDSSGGAASIIGNLSLMTGVVVVSPGAGPVDLNIGAVILGSAGLIKNGTGDIQLTRAVPILTPERLS